jgi:hypothetical protein
VCLHHSVVIDQLNVADINVDASSIIAVANQEVCGIRHGVHLAQLAMFFSDMQHIKVKVTLLQATKGLEGE